MIIKLKYKRFYIKYIAKKCYIEECHHRVHKIGMCKHHLKLCGVLMDELLPAVTTALESIFKIMDILGIGEDDE